MCYMMLNHLGVQTEIKLLGIMYGLPASWKDAIILIIKPGNNPTNPTCYWPSALSSHVGKTTERRITERMTFYIESKGWLSPDQSGFRKRRGTMDSVICLETEIIYKSVWKEGLLIHLYKMRIKGRTFNCVRASAMREDSIKWQASVIHVLLVLLELISESNNHVFKLS